MYKLEPLTFGFGDLVPVLSSDTISTHYQKHHQNYLNKLNELLVKNNYNFNYSLEELVNHLDLFPIADRDDILFNLGGVLNHNLYWNSLSPNHNTVPTGKLARVIEREYQNFTNFKENFIKIANKLVGSGYTFLVLDKEDHLNIINLSNQETPYYYGLRPIMALDLWEHAYYLDYRNLRSNYITNFFSIVDFDKIEKNYEKEIQQKNI